MDNRDYNDQNPERHWTDGSAQDGQTVSGNAASGIYGENPDPREGSGTFQSWGSEPKAVESTMSGGTEPSGSYRGATESYQETGTTGTWEHPSGSVEGTMPGGTEPSRAYRETAQSYDGTGTDGVWEHGPETTGETVTGAGNYTEPPAGHPSGSYGGGMTWSGSGEAEVDYSVAKGESVRIDSTAGYRNDDSGAYGSDISDRTGDYRYYNNGYSEGSAASGGTDGRQQYSGYYATPQGESARKKTEKKSSGAFRRFLAAMLVIALCGVAGFSGATIANRNAASRNHSGTSNVNITGDVTSVNAASAISEKVMPSVVGISTVAQSQRQTIFGLQRGMVQGIGTGIIVSEDGYILTNSHVINDGNTEQITVDLYDGTEYSGKVLWNDSSLDLAIVKIEASNLTAAELGDSDEIHIGDYALAIGNPLGLNYERSVTSGIISGLNRAITTQDESTGKTNNMDGLIQTDAAINSGNSGGPLINSSGQVIGITTAKASSSEGLGFAIPINTTTPIIKQIREKGSYEQTYIGISGVDLSTITENYATDFDAKSGVYIMQIYTSSPAAEAGLKEGDIITEIDGKAIDGMSALKSRMINYTPGDEVELTVERNKAQEKIKLVLGSSADATSTLQSNQNQLPDNSGTEGGSGSDGFGGYGGYGGYGSGSDGGLGSLFGQ